MLNRRLVSFVAIVSFLVGVIAVPSVQAGLAKEQPLQGPAADFTLKNKAGGNVRLAE